jgi:hypothetical protein
MLIIILRGKGVDTIQTKQNRVAREQKQAQHLPIRHAGRLADFTVLITIFKQKYKEISMCV